MLDTRLTPLERDGRRMLRMLRAADGTSPLCKLDAYAGGFGKCSGQRKYVWGGPPGRWHEYAMVSAAHQCTLRHY